MNVPRIVVAGTQSGVGKTSITLGIVALLRRRGLRVQTFKVGPDYLDPTHLALASGRPCYNLDGWMMGEAYVRQLFARATADADIAIVEGVMGLFDGADPVSPEGSTAEIARWLGASVLLVINAQGLGGSVAAVVHGYASFDPDPKLRIAGIIANWCGSERHAKWMEKSLRGASLPRLIGAVQRGALPEIPSRHLGLVTADAGNLSRNILERLADAVESSVAIEEILRVESVSDAAPQLQCQRAVGRMPIGIARDEAFSFYYPDNLEALEQKGCELVPFSPLHDGSLPEGLCGLYFGGGYPEEHAAALACNAPMLSAIRSFAEEKVVYAECGGLMYLSQGIETLGGLRHSLVALLPAWTRMRPTRQTLGYVEITLTRDCLWGHPGEQLRGHEFHYSELVERPDWPRAYDVRYRRSARVSREGFQNGTVLASYAHLHFASRPGAVEQLVRCMART